jgi:alpha/beta hydrolase fold
MHSAHLRLPGSGGLRLVWPDDAPRAVMVVLVEAGQEAAGERLPPSDVLGVVARLEDGAVALEWTADHAAQLGADGAPLLLAGLGPGAAAAATLAIRSHDAGWPAVARQVLVHPRFDGDPPSPPRGVAPATVIGESGRAYAAHLRGAGVEVEHLAALRELGRRSPGG